MDLGKKMPPEHLSSLLLNVIDLEKTRLISSLLKMSLVKGLTMVELCFNFFWSSVCCLKDWNS